MEREPIARSNPAEAQTMPDDERASEAEHLLPWWLLTLGFAVVLFLFSIGISEVPLFEPDEGRYAEIPREMIATGDGLTPRLNGVLYFDKPPLYYWLTAASIRVFGLNEFSVRFWSVLFALVGIALAFLLGRTLAGVRFGALAALLLGTSPLYLAMGHISTIDMTVSILLSVCITCFWYASRSPPGGWRLALWLGMFLASGLAVLAKGLIGIAIPGGVVLLFLMISREWTLLFTVPWIRGLLLFFITTVPWHVAMSLHHPSFAWFYFVHEHLLRYSTQVAYHAEPWWFFLPILALGMLPWSGCLPPAVLLLRKGVSGGEERRLVQLCWCWVVWVLLFFSVSHSKLIPYVLPAFVPLAVLAVAGFRSLLEARKPLARIMGRLGWGLAAITTMLLCAAVTWIGRGGRPDLLPPGTLAVWMPFATGVAALVALCATIFDPRRAPRRVLVCSFLATACLSATVTLAAPAFGDQTSTRGVARYLAPRLTKDVSVVSFGFYPRSLSAYLGRLIDVVYHRGELAFGIDHLSPAERQERFPYPDEFRSRWESDEPIFLVVRKRSLGAFTAISPPPHAVAFEAGEFLVLANRTLQARESHP